MDWRQKLVSPNAVFERMRPGMSVFLSTGAAEPRTLVKHLMATREGMLIWCYPRTASITEEEYNLCMRQFESMPNLARMLVSAGKLPPWAGDHSEAVSDLGKE